MTNRITGLATGLDIDSLVSAELSGYKSKITKQQQGKEILAIQQEMYRDVISQGSSFYDKYLNIAKSNSLLSGGAYTTTTFSSSNENAVTATSVSGSAIKDTYKVNVKQLASSASTVLDISKFKGVNGDKITVKVGDKEETIDLSSILNSDKSDLDKNKDLVTALNNNLSSLGLKASYSQISGGVILESKAQGESQSFKIVDDMDRELVPEAKGKDAIYTIASSTNTTPGEPAGKEFKSSSNTVTLDGISFSFTSTTEDEPVVIAGKTDASSTVDKIYNFFEDYNSMLTNFQTLLSEKHDRNYSPLTEEQKSAMTDSQISKWEEKVKQGQLRNDSLVSSFVSQMKTALSAQTAALKEIGITTTKNYDSKAGTYEVDKEKLKEAIEKDPEGVMKLFMATEKTTKDKDGNTVSIPGSGGVFTSLKNVMYDNTISPTKSSIIIKAGKDANSVNSTISKQITTYAKNISQMQSTLSTKEQKLYSKYAGLETIMNKYNTQLAQLQSYFS